MKEGVASAARALTYLHGDHLGSASLTTNASGNVVSQQRYKPYGELRWSSGAGMPTDKQFTGQTRLAEGYVGTLYDYVARAYDPVLGRFISADTIVPGAGNPQALNRYMYVLGSVLRRIDPSGHTACDGMSNQAWWECRWRSAHGEKLDQNSGIWRTGDAEFVDSSIADDVANEVGVRFVGSNDADGDPVRSWAQGERDLVLSGMVALVNKVGGMNQFRSLRGNSLVTLIRAVTFGMLSPRTPANTDPVFRGNRIWFYDVMFTTEAARVRATSVHEMAHIMAYHNLLPANADDVRQRIEDVVPHTGSPVSEYAAQNNLNLEYWADSVMVWVYDKAPRTNPQPLDVNVANCISSFMSGTECVP